MLSGARVRWVLLVVALGWFGGAHADAPPAVSPQTHAEAQRHLEVGRKLFAQGDYDSAERELLVGQELEPLPVFNYTLGQVERVLGRCNRAIDYYREYLKVADAGQRASTQVQINRCQEVLAQRGQTYHPGGEREPEAPLEVKPVDAKPVEPAPVVAIVEPAPPPPPPVKKWYRDGLGMGLVGGGAALVVAGAVLVGVGDPMDPRRTYGTLEEARDRRWMSPTGIAFLSVGGALVIGGAVRLALVKRRASR